MYSQEGMVINDYDFLTILVWLVFSLFYSDIY